jgi:hypothetical protein
MENIEVTNSTFFKVFTNTTSDFINTERLESAHKHFYYNAESEQKGIIIMNFTSSKVITQYYLTDINA